MKNNFTKLSKILLGLIVLILTVNVSNAATLYWRGSGSITPTQPAVVNIAATTAATSGWYDAATGGTRVVVGTTNDLEIHFNGAVTGSAGYQLTMSAAVACNSLKIFVEGTPVNVNVFSLFTGNFNLTAAGAGAGISIAQNTTGTAGTGLFNQVFLQSGTTNTISTPSFTMTNGTASNGNTVNSCHLYVQTGATFTCTGAFTSTCNVTSTATNNRVANEIISGGTLTIGGTATINTTSAVGSANVAYNTIGTAANGIINFNGAVNIGASSGGFNPCWLSGRVATVSATGFTGVGAAAVGTVNFNNNSTITFDANFVQLSAGYPATININGGTSAAVPRTLNIAAGTVNTAFPNTVFGSGANNAFVNITGNNFQVFTTTNVTIQNASVVDFNSVSISTPGNTYTQSGTARAIFSANNFPSGWTTGPSLSAGSTVEYDGTTAQSISGVPTAYGNVIFSNSGTKTFSGVNRTVAGDLTINTGATVDLGSTTLNRASAGGTLTIDGTSKLIIGGTSTTFPANYSTHALTSGNTVEYNGTTQTVGTLNSSQSYSNLLISGSSTATLAGNQPTEYLTIGSGAGLDLSTFTLTSLLTATLNATSNLFVGGATNFAPTGGMTADATSTVTYNRNGNQDVYDGASAQYGNLVLTGTSGTKTPSGSLYVKGNFTVASTVTVDFGSSGFISYTGAAAQVSTGTYTVPFLFMAKTGTGDLTITSGAANMVNIAGGIDFSGMAGASRVVITTNGNLTIKSDATRTAYIGNQAPAGTGYSITGGTTIERYIDLTYTRRWHLLSPPVFTGSSVTIYNDWQLSGGSSNTYGTFITNPAVYGPPGSIAPFTTTNDAVNFWDRVSTNLQTGASSSIRAVSPTGALSTISATNVAFTSNFAWFLFVRSARPAGTYNNSLASSTTLRTSSGINQNSTITKTIGTGVGVVTVNNPFASPVTISGSVIPQNSGTNRVFYAWDPGYGGALGGYKLYTNNTTAATGGAFPTTMNQMQSGQAIFVPQGGAGGSVSFNEASKTTTVYGNVLRNTGASINNSIIIRLQSLDETNSLIERDLTYADFDGAYSNDFIGGEDVVKLGNFNENLSLKRGGQYIYKEGMQQPTANDSLHVQLWKTTATPYKFEIEANGLDANMEAYLVDTYLGTQTPLNTSGISTYDFTSNGANTDLERFKIVFRQASLLPVSITNIKAYKQNTGVNVEWNVAQESGIVNYEVERSTNGNTFSKFAAVNATNAAIAHNYTAYDAAPVNGTNYYRVKSIGLNGQSKYTAIVKVTLGKDGNATVSVYPNPVKGGEVNISLANLAKGAYTLAVYSNDGKQIAVKNVTISNSGTVNETISLPAGTAKGVYQLKVTGSNNFTQQLIVE